MAIKYSSFIGDPDIITPEQRQEYGIQTLAEYQQAGGSPYLLGNVDEGLQYKTTSPDKYANMYKYFSGKGFPGIEDGGTGGGGGGGGGNGGGNGGNGDEPPVGGYPGSEDEWGNQSDPNNPIYSPPPEEIIDEPIHTYIPPDNGGNNDDNNDDDNDYGDDDWGNWGAYNRGGRVYLNLGGLARPFFYGGLARLL